MYVLPKLDQQISVFFVMKLKGLHFLFDLQSRSS